jgi:hypothetical protein
LSKQLTALSIQERDNLIAWFDGFLDACTESDNGERIQAKNRQAERVSKYFGGHYAHAETGERTGSGRENNPFQLADFPARLVEQLLNSWRE